MRPEFVRLIKNVLSKNPEYLKSIPSFRSEIMTIGATQEELDQALRELGVTGSSLEDSSRPLTKPEKTSLKEKLKKMQNQPGFLKKLVEIDIVTHIAVAIVFIIPISIWVLTTIQKHSAPSTAASTMVSAVSTDKEQGGILVPKVYASSSTINADRVFSFPPSNITLRVSGRPKKDVYGFFPYWMLPTEEKVQIDELTTIGLFGLEVDGGGNIITGKNESPDGGWVMWNDPKVNDLISRARRKRIRVELTIKAFDKTNIEKLVLSDDAQKTFISNVLHLVNLKSLNGVNLDFEYIGKPSDAVAGGFTRLVTNLNAELKRQVPGSTLTVDSYINAASIPGLIDVELVAEQVDSFVIMGYDIHTPSGDPGPVAPIDGPVSILGFLQSYLEKVSPDKLILAVPYYGYDWGLDSKGDALPDSGKTVPYAEAAELAKGKKINWDEVAQSPSIRYTDSVTNTPRTLYFENTRSLGLKYDLINKKGLKGVGIWALGYDGLNNDLTSVIVEKFSN
jgi:spore germination protein YaaH